MPRQSEVVTVKNLKRNEQSFWYANLADDEPIRDENGLRTGESRLTYAEPVLCRGNIAPATGTVSIEQFGTVEAYDRVIVLCDPDLPIASTAVFWLNGEEPLPDRSNFDHIVGRIGRSLNSITILVKEVDVQ